MSAKSKRMKANEQGIDRAKKYRLGEAVALLKKMQKPKFDESVDVSVVLGIDPKKSDQFVRGATVLPHGLGKTVKVLVFAEGKGAEEAKEAGADEVGSTLLAERIEKSGCDFDIVIATPATMPLVGRLGRILGPAGLMPNPKDGTVTDDVEKAVKNAKAGQIKYRADKGGVVHGSIGRISFSEVALVENCKALIAELIKAKPTAAKGAYLKGVFLSLTMGPSVRVEPSLSS